MAAELPRQVTVEEAERVLPGGGHRGGAGADRLTVCLSQVGELCRETTFKMFYSIYISCSNKFVNEINTELYCTCL